ncbi:hypothetical protein FDI24_gp062 [Acidovorax phage ACP17]|uniref:Holin n=1 Tax=Acidovorax phage ACP17 TaxID=2010329 RepID=A0A223AIY5_9CAUD|nr:hypothetical protein FDI24_gp062 [Acidovorax phage ACP17]ASS33927.1 hypothetical protein [Acidovorax phage ACP17]
MKAIKFFLAFIGYALRRLDPVTIGVGCTFIYICNLDGVPAGISWITNITAVAVVLKSLAHTWKAFKYQTKGRSRLDID